MILLGLTLPAALFGLVVATLLAAALHLWRGGKVKLLVLYIGCSWAGFWLGHFMGKALRWSFLQVGPIMFGMALLGCAAALAFGYWLGRGEYLEKMRNQ